MGFLKHFRSRARLRSQQELQDYPKPRGPDRTGDISDKILATIFAYTCPSATDETYKVNEKSLVGAGCSLCDVRDLANCAKVNRRWYSIAQSMLYHSVRIDAVHFCELEEDLREQRKKKKIDPSEIPADRLRLFQQSVWKNASLANQVLFLKLPYMTRESCKGDLARTVSALPNLRHVDLPDGFFNADPSSQILRDELQASCPEIRRMVYRAGSEQAFEMLAQHRLWLNLESITLENLDIDLSVLRIVLASMPVLSEVKLRNLPRLDDMAFQATPNLPNFPPLQKLQIRNAPGITSEGLVSYLSAPEAREVLSFLGLSFTGVTIPTLHTVTEAATHLTHLSILAQIERGMPLDPLPAISSTSISTLNFEVISNDPHPASTTSYAYGHGYSTTPLTRPADSYYTYLASSISANALPNLTKLYVRDSSFPDLLLLPPSPHLPAGRGFHQMLEIYTKGDDDLDWVVTPFTSSQYAPQAPVSQPLPQLQTLSLRPPPPSSSNTLAPPTAPYATGVRNSYVAHKHTRNDSLSSSSPTSSAAISGRPVSAYGAKLSAGGMGPDWGVGEARKSVMLGNGMGGFLEVPQAPPMIPAAVEESALKPRPGSSGRGRSVSPGGARPGSSGSIGGFLKGHFRTESGRGSRADLWR